MARLLTVIDWIDRLEVAEVICWALNIVLWTMMWGLTAFMVAEMAVMPGSLIIPNTLALAGVKW